MGQACDMYIYSHSSQIHDYRKATQSSSHLSPMKLSSVQTTPEQTAIDTDTATHSTIQETEFLPKSKELTEALLKPNERELVVEDSSGEGANTSSSSATALNMHDSTTQQ